MGMHQVEVPTGLVIHRIAAEESTAPQLPLELYHYRVQSTGGEGSEASPQTLQLPPYLSIAVI